MILQRIENPRRRKLFAGASSLLAAAVVAVGIATPGVVSAQDHVSPAIMAARQNVDWMSADTASYLTSIGMDVLVPSWVPSPFGGVAPDVFAGDGSYSLYWMVPADVPTFLHITGVVGAAFPAGSKADLNVPLSINESVQGWPAIRDIGIPAGGSTPIYDQVWWIAGGVRYSVESNNIGADSLSIADSMVYLQAPVYEPVPTDVPYVPPTEIPYVPPTEAPYVPPTQVPGPVLEEPAVQQPVTNAPVVAETGVTPTQAPAQTGNSGSQTDQTSSTGQGGTADGPWSPGVNDTNVPSDGTSGPRPPVIGGDGTGGWFDTSLPRVVFYP